MSLLDVHDLAGACSRCDEVGLTAEEGWYLQDVHIFGCHLGLLSLVDIRHYGDVEGLAYTAQDAQSLLVTDAREAIDTRAVGLAIRALEDIGDA